MARPSRRKLVLSVVLNWIVYSLLRYHRSDRQPKALIGYPLSPVTLITEWWGKLAHFFDWIKVRKGSKIHQELQHVAPLLIPGDGKAADTRNIVTDFLALNMTNDRVYTVVVLNNGQPYQIISLFMDKGKAALKLCALILKQDGGVLGRPNPQFLWARNPYTGEYYEMLLDEEGISRKSLRPDTTLI